MNLYAAAQSQLAEYRAEIEKVYCRKFLFGENWCLFEDKLIVVHPDRVPLVVHKGGKTEELKLVEESASQ